MLSGKLIQLIEGHGDEITASIIAAVRHHPELPHFRQLPEWELRQRGDEILPKLGHWLAYGNEGKLAHEYEAIGKRRFEESVPLDECVRGLCLIKDKMIAFLDNQGIDQDALNLYAEEQLERRVGRFFDMLVVHLVRGYEAAWRCEQMTAMTV
jgi:hypothetical protein